MHGGNMKLTIIGVYTYIRWLVHRIT